MAARRGSGSRGKAGGKSSIPALIVQALTVAGGLYIGIQAYGFFQRLRAAAHAPGPTAAPSTTPHRPHREPVSETTRPGSPGSDDERTGSSTQTAQAPRRPDQLPATPAVPAPNGPAECCPSPSGPAGEPETAAANATGNAPGAGAGMPPDSPESPRVEITPQPPAQPPTGRTPARPPQAGPGSGRPQAVAPVPGMEIDRGSGRRREVALTFDAGADWRPVKQILEALAVERVKCTFFLTGEWVQRNPRTSRLIVEQGHEIGNHSWNHPPFTSLGDEAIRDQLRRTEGIIQETLGLTSRPYFRPPLGSRDSRVLRVVGSEGFFTIYWTVDSRDSVDPGITSFQIRDRVLGKSGPGSIVLMHCGSQATAGAVPEILRGLKSRGLTPVTISRLLTE
jgi:peptidoglycan-N-acetylmuramic acid deacetylase